MSAANILGSTATGAGAGAAAGPIGAAVGAGVGLLGGLAAYFIGRPGGDPAAAARLQAQRAADLNRQQMMAMAAGARGPGGPIAAMRQAGAQASQVTTNLQSNAMAAAANAVAQRDALENQRKNQILGGTISAIGSGIASGVNSGSGSAPQAIDAERRYAERQNALQQQGMDGMLLSDERRKDNVSDGRSAIQRYLDSLPGAASVVVRDASGREIGQAGLRRSPPPQQPTVVRPGPMMFQYLDHSGNPQGVPVPNQSAPYPGDQMVYRDEATGHTTRPDPMTYVDTGESRKSGGSPVQSYLDGVKPVAFDYKNQEDGAGRQYGVMAQDLASTPAGRQAVVETPRGLAIDPARAIGPVMAAQGQLNERLRRLEGGQPLIGADDQARLLSEASITAGQSSAPYARRPAPRQGPINMDPMVVRGEAPPPGPDPMEEARYSYMMQNIAGRLPSGRQADRDESVRLAVSDAKRDMNTGHDAAMMRLALSLSPSDLAVWARQDPSRQVYVDRVRALNSDSGRYPSTGDPRGR